MSAKSSIKVSASDIVSFDPDLGPEEGAEAAWAHIQKLIVEHNDLQRQAIAEAWNEALDRASELVGERADQEMKTHADPATNKADAAKAQHAALCLNAAAISLSTLKKSID